MNITFAPRGILQIDDANIAYRNFSGAGSKFNREGDRNFSLIIENRDLTMDEVSNILEMYNGSYLADTEHGPILRYRESDIVTIAEALTAFGWNVKIKLPREEGDAPFIHLPVKVKFHERGPIVYLKTGDRVNKLDEESIGCLDDVDIIGVDLDIRPYNWEVNGKAGCTAYLQSIHVTQEVDRFAERYADDY